MAIRSHFPSLKLSGRLNSLGHPGILATAFTPGQLRPVQRKHSAYTVAWSFGRRSASRLVSDSRSNLLHAWLRKEPAEREEFRLTGQSVYQGISEERRGLIFFTSSLRKTTRKWISAPNFVWSCEREKARWMSASAWKQQVRISHGLPSRRQPCAIREAVLRHIEGTIGNDPFTRP